MDKKNFVSFVRRYPTDEVIKYFSKVSMEMFNKKEPFMWETVPYFYKKSGIKAGSVEFVYAQHELISICYYSILHGNDYRNKLINKEDGIELLDKLKKYKNECAGKDNKVPEKFNEFFAILFNEQIQFQKIPLSIELFNRLCFIMSYINKKYTNHPEYIDFDSEVKELTNMSIDEYNEINLFITLITVGTMDPNLSELINSIQLDFSKFRFNKDDLYSFIFNDAHDYKYYRNLDNDSENWNNLKYSPIVITDKKKELLVVNIYAFIISFASKLYWIIRNKYKELNSNRFTNYFGYCFEMYLLELFNFYKIENYKKIKENKTKQPDWLVETDDYNILIEQKATLFTIGSRDTTLNNKYEELEKYLDVIKKGFVQLSNYKTSNEKTTIRICLTFEEVDGVECIQEAATEKLNIDDKEMYWVVNIGEFEKLIFLLKNNYEKFKEVITKKINLEKSHDKNGRSFDMILSDENDYIKNRIDYFYKISLDLENKLKVD